MSVIGTDSGVATGIEKFLACCEGRWPADQPRPRLLTRAPGRLDCMGGMADYSGALALQMPLERAVLVVVGRRDDQQVLVETVDFDGGEGATRCDWPLSLFYRSDGQLITGSDLAARFSATPWVRHIASVMLALLESGEVPHLGGGLTLMLKSDIPVRAGLASSAAIKVAVARAVAGLFEVDITPTALLRACRAAAEVVDRPPGLVDDVTCLLGEADALLQIRCQPDDVLGPMPLPRDVTLAAVDVGVRLPIYAQRYADNHVASMMGRHIIERLLQASGEVGDPTGGYLANIAPSEYVRRFRNELPVKIRGADFLDRFGANEELASLIDRGRIYKVRSRTEHHIYENDRTHRFMERLARVRRTGGRDALVEAGELMYASHWSYGQRCGMGSIETDTLVNRIRELGPSAGLYGAKATAGGCGGSLAVLMARSDAAVQALEQACAAYAAKTGREPTILLGSSSGAMAFGCRMLD